jgi:opacity protein-like surface antigen
MPDDRGDIGPLRASQQNGEPSMRWVISALIMLGLPAHALAQDFGVLRGSIPTYHWGGFYGGGQISDSSSNMNFGQAAGSELSYVLRNTAIEADQHISGWTVLGSRLPTSTGYGAFVGYNSEWECLVLGVEANYTHFSGLSASSADSIARSFTDSTNLPAGHNYVYSANVSAQSSMKITDIATFRGRAGWEVGNFLPYAFGGFAVGRANWATSATFAYTAFDSPTPSTPPIAPLPPMSYGPVGSANGANGTFLYGVAAGLGMDWALTTNLFVRGEFEYVYFAPTAHIQASVTTARVGAGFKF